MEDNNVKNVKKNNNWILIAIIIVLVISLLGLSYYTFFVQKNDNNLNNNTEKENELKNEINTILNNFPYDSLIYGNEYYDNESQIISKKTLNDLSDTEILLLISKKLDFKSLNSSMLPIGECLLKRNECSPENINVDKYKKLYEQGENACKVQQNAIDMYAMCSAKKLDIPNNQIEIMDTSLWKNFYGNATDDVDSDSIYMLTKTQFDNVLRNEIGLSNKFNDSFVNGRGDFGTFVYDKSIEKIFYRKTSYFESKFFWPYQYYVKSGTKENNKFIITILEGYFDIKDDGIINLIARSDKNKIIEEYKNFDTKTFFQSSSIKEKLEEHMEQLDSYEITFIKEKNNYQFEKIELVY